MRWSLPLLFASIVTFVIGAGLTMIALARASTMIATVAILVMTISISLFLFSIWGRRRKVDWERIQAEQRLWESGPLGRAWLRTRKRLYNLWKI